MAIGLHRLGNTKAVAALGLGKHSDGGGLMLYHTARGRSWVMRFTIGGKRREIGLGSFEKLSLAGARSAAAEMRLLLERGDDPKAVRDAERAASKHDVDRNAPSEIARRTLSAVIDRTFEAEKATLKGEGKAGRWRSPLDTHVTPKLGKRDVETITPKDIDAALRGVWITKPDVARKALQRLGKAMAYARAEGLDVGRDVVADARDILGKQLRVSKNIPAMAWQEVPDFYATLGEGPVDLCLRLLILSAVRSRPARFAHADHFKGSTWTIPAHLMKGSAQQAQDEKNDFVVPLPPEAVAVIDAALQYAVDGFLFCGPKGKPISDMSMSARMRRDKLDARPHGMRAAFRTWAQEETTASYEAREMSLAHKIGGLHERAYVRTDLLQQRRVLLDTWAAYVTRRPAENIASLDEARRVTSNG